MESEHIMISHQRSTNRKRHRALSLLSGSPVILALCLTACGSSTSATGTNQDAGGGPDAAADVGVILASPEPCTGQHTICMNMKVPSTMVGQPLRLLFDIYDSSDPPSHLPNGFAGVFTAPTLTAGQTIYLELSDAQLLGDYFMWVVMYMPGGGYGAPVTTVDYIMQSAPAPLHLDGTPLNIPAQVILLEH
jgi:hypothetical protein